MTLTPVIPSIVIAPSGPWVPLRLREVWAHRELLYFLAWRDIKVRYKQTALGVAWAVIQPFFTMLVFSIFFGRLAGVPSDGVPYPLFVYCALLPWQLFSHALLESSNSLVNNERLITKVYFPRLVIPIATIVSGLIDFVVASVVFGGMLWYYGVRPGPNIVAVPLFVLLAVGAALGVGLWLSSLNVRYRDVRYAIPFLVQFWMLATPVAYPASLVPEKWRTLYALNPLTGVVEGTRWAFLSTGEFPGALVAVSAAVIALLVLSGVVYFRRMERVFADVV